MTNSTPSNSGPADRLAANLAHVEDALSSVLEMLSMIDITERDYADTWPTLAGTEAGRVALATRPGLALAADDLRATSVWLAAGNVSQVPSRELADEAEVLVRNTRTLLSLAVAEIRKG